jgi:hypothetical protein
MREFGVYDKLLGKYFNSWVLALSGDPLPRILIAIEAIGCILSRTGKVKWKSRVIGSGSFDGGRPKGR